MDYVNLNGPDGQSDNMGGLTQRLYFARVQDFASIKTPVAPFTTPDDLVTISTAHTFNTGKCFKRLYCTMDKGKLDAKTQGETDGKSFKLEGEIFYPGSLADAHGFASLIKNDNLIIIAEHPDSTDNGNLQVGTEQFPAKIDPEFTTGTNASGVKGYTFKFYSMSPRVYVYTGAITLTPAP